MRSKITLVSNNWKCNSIPSTCQLQLSLKTSESAEMSFPDSSAGCWRS